MNAYKQAGTVPRSTCARHTMLQLTKELKRPVDEVISEISRLMGTADQVLGVIGKE